MLGIEPNFVVRGRLHVRGRNRCGRGNEQPRYDSQINPASGLLGSAYLR